MKYIATQVEPECQINLWEQNDHDGIKAWANYCRRADVIKDDIPSWSYAESLCTEAWDYRDAILSGKWPKLDTYLNVREFIAWNLPLREWTDDEVRRIIAALRSMLTRTDRGYDYHEEQTKDILAVLSVAHGKHYVLRGFRGYSQGDYIEIAYAEEDYPDGSIGYVAADALAQYDEFDVEDETGDSCGYIVYHDYGSAPCKSAEEQLKEELGMKPGDTLVIRTINGGSWTPSYDEKEVVA